MVILNPYAFGVPLTLAFVNSVIAAANSIDISGSGRQAGDIGMMFDYAVDPGGVSAVTPTGHTNGHNTSPFTSIRAMISAKILTGSEGSIAGMSSAFGVSKMYLIYRPSRPVVSLAFNSPNNTATSGNPAPQTIAASASATVPALLYGQMIQEDGNAISPRSVAPAMNEIPIVASWHYAHHLAYNSSPLDHSYDMDDEGSTGQIMQSGYLTFI